MSQHTQLKEQLLEHLHKLLDEKIEVARHSMTSAKEARDDDTKSSAGDKYETDRAMMQMEVEKYQVQLGKTFALKNELAQINPSKSYSKAEFGCLVVCNTGNYFLAIGIGKIVIQQEIYYCLSTASPIGVQLLGKGVGDQVQFQGRTIVIQDLI